LAANSPVTIAGSSWLSSFSWDELSAYCLEGGLYPEQVERWRQASQDASEKPVLSLREQRELEKLRVQEQRNIKGLKPPAQFTAG
jgi:hypothetical protein